MLKSVTLFDKYLSFQISAQLTLRNSNEWKPTNLIFNYVNIKKFTSTFNLKYGKVPTQFLDSNRNRNLNVTLVLQMKLHNFINIVLFKKKPWLYRSET